VVGGGLQPRRWSFLKTLGGHRRYPEAEIRELAEGLREAATA